MVTYWQLPEGLRMLPDGAWRVGGFPILHLPSLRLLKARLVFDEDGAFIVVEEDGAFYLRVGGRRIPIAT